MSLPLISRSPDLVRLRNDGFTVSIQANHLVVDDIPFVEEVGRSSVGRMVCPLNHSGGDVMAPNTHVMYWAGPEPLDHNGARLLGHHGELHREIAPGLKVDHQYSIKIVENGQKRDYRDYYEKVTTYAHAFGDPATAFDPDASPRAFRAVPTEDGDTSPFRYLDTASSRAGITAVSARFSGQTIAIVGLGGTGAYILDLVAKTPVAKILVFDDDKFLQHNAFRSPGAAPYSSIESRESKVDYLAGVYSEIHAGIVKNAKRNDEGNVALLDEAHFVFVAIDDGPSKEAIFGHLGSKGIPFIDVGLGVSLVDTNQLVGQLRVTLSTKEQRDHVAETVSTNALVGGDDYDANIQVADLNALNAALAVVRWKRLVGFYRSTQDEHHSLFRLRDAAHLREVITGGPGEG